MKFEPFINGLKHNLSKKSSQFIQLYAYVKRQIAGNSLNA